MNQKFRDLVASLEPKYRALLEMEPVRFGSLPKEIPERGIYVFSEGGQHLYVGRTNGIRRRLRIAARRFRRGCTRMSITSPSSSTARHKYCVRPCIRTNSSSRYHVSPWRPRRRRSRRAYSSSNVRHHWRIVSYVTLMPRSARRSSTSRKLRLNRWYNHTA